MFEDWIGLIISITTLIGGIAGASAILRKITSKEIKEIKEVQYIMMECHDVTLQALEIAAKGGICNGEIERQRKKLQAFMIKKTID